MLYLIIPLYVFVVAFLGLYESLEFVLLSILLLLILAMIIKIYYVMIKDKK